MIKGKATLEVTKATVIAALQRYFDDCSAPGYAFRVDGINMDIRGNWQTADKFALYLSELPVKI